MLPVTGLILKDLKARFKKTSGHLLENSQLQVSLHNGAKALVFISPTHVVVVGNNGEGIAVFFSEQNTRYEGWWSEKYTPCLVNTRYAVNLIH
jgi:hypothetical protein